MPPSSRQAQDAKITITSAHELHAHFTELAHLLSVPETEDTWQKLDCALAKLQAITKGGATKFPHYVSQLKQLSQPIINSLLSERTRLSGTAGDLINSVAPRLADRFESLVNVFVPTLLLICARTNKVAVKRAEKSLHLICKHCRLASLVPFLKEAARDKSQGLRAVAMGCMLTLLESTEKAKLSRRILDIEASIKGGATDPNPEVRQISKKAFELYIAIWPERVELFTKPMTPTIRRYLALPKTGPLVVDIPIETDAAPATVAPSFESTKERTAPAASASAAASTSSCPARKVGVPSASRAAVIEPQDEAAPLELADLPSSSTMKRSLFAEQLAAMRRQHKVPRGAHSHEDASSSMRGPSAEDIHRSDWARAAEEAAETTLAQRAHRGGEEMLHPTASLRATSTSQHGRNEMATLGTHASEFPASSSFHQNSLSASLGPSGSSRYAGTTSSGSTVSSFAKASGLHGRSQILAAYNHAFNKEHLRTSSHPDLGSLAASASRSGPAPQSSNRSRADLPAASRSRSDDTPSSDPIGWHAHHEAGCYVEERMGSSPVDTGRSAPPPSEGVAQRLMLAQQRQLRGAHEASSTEREGRPPQPPSSTLGGIGGEREANRAQTKPHVKASRVPATRPAPAPAPAKASAVRVARPIATPSASKTSTLRASTTSSLVSTPAAPASASETKQVTAATPVTAASSAVASAATTTAPAAIKATATPKNSVSKPAVKASAEERTAASTQKQAASASKGLGAVRPPAKSTLTAATAASKARAAAAPIKKFQPKLASSRTDAKSRGKVVSSTSAALAPKSKLLGGDPKAPDKKATALLKKSGQSRAVATGPNPEAEKRNAVPTKTQAAAASPEAALSTVARPPTAPPETAPAAVAEAEAKPSDAPSSKAQIEARKDSARAAMPAPLEGVAEAEAPKRTPLGARDLNVARSSPMMSSRSTQKAKPELVRSASSPAAKLAAVAVLQRAAAASTPRSADTNADTGAGAGAGAAVVALCDGSPAVRKIARAQGGYQLVLGEGDAASDAETVVLEA
ncbi:hypothetical protein ACQY0O_008009 [Thecaphora frezii]